MGSDHTPTERTLRDMTRRRFLEVGALAGIGFTASACGTKGTGGSNSPSDSDGEDATDESSDTTGAAADFSAVTAELEAAIAEGIVPAAGLIVLLPDSVVYREAFGTYTPDSTDVLWSATKLASATAAMTLVDEGLIDLNDPISRFLPQFSGTEATIMVRQLLNQTHGLPFDHPSVAPPQVDNGLTLAESVDQIARDIRGEVPPGTRFKYAPSVSYAILGRIGEIATGQSWTELFTERVGGPLTMDTFSYGPGQNPRVGGGAVASLDDYANLLRMHLRDGELDGTRVLSEASVLEMQRDQLAGVPFSTSIKKEEHGYGLTWWFDEVDSTGAAIQVSVPGGRGAIPWLDLEHRYGAFLLVSKDAVSGVAVYERILPLIRQALDLS